jgi:hypothetical protein
MLAIIFDLETMRVEHMTINWDEVRRNKFAAQSGPPDWDSSIRPITMDGTSLIGVDPQGRLYWDGQRLAVDSLRLSYWQKVGAVVVAGSSAIAAIAASVSAYVELMKS